MLIQVNGKRYKGRNIYELPLETLLALEDETTAMGKPLNLGIMQEMFDEVEKIKHKVPAEQARLRGRSPFGGWTFAINLFCAMRVAGDVSTFAEVLKISPADVEFLREPGDPEELETLGVREVTPDPTKRPKPTPKASSRAAKSSARTTQAKRSQAARSRKASTAG